nr:hypothetical protein L203_03938 [Cryptococcus depauperatus CBS 7841]
MQECCWEQSTAEPLDSTPRPLSTIASSRRSWIYRERQEQASNTSSVTEPSTTRVGYETSVVSNASYSASLAPNTSEGYTSGTGWTDPSTRASRTTSFTSLWSYSATESGSSHTASSTKPAFVPGATLNLTLAGQTEVEAVYSVKVKFGHQDDSGRKRASYKDDGGYQSMNLQVDLGSSDMWVATKDCTTLDCVAAPFLYNQDHSLSSDIYTNITYQSGQVNGMVYWEEIDLAGFRIGFQAFVGATQVTNENLKGGGFAGVLGLALPASSNILSEVGGTTSSNPDGATLLDNLFGAGSSAPSSRLFALSLERRQDVRTLSQLGIGEISPIFCPSPCNPSYIPIVSQPNLGATGYLHWRIRLRSLSVTTWNNEQAGTGQKTVEVPIGGSFVFSNNGPPLAVLDSGGVQILVGSRNYADVIYGAYGIQMSPDGFYRMPCTKQIALTFNIDGQDFPVHPLDMTYPDTSDPSQTTCVGMIQYSDKLGGLGDFILGSSFLKNVYSIYQYPDTNSHSTWQPTVGLVSLTNASIASQDFYAVRVLHQSLSLVSSNQASTNPNAPGYNPTPHDGDTSAGKKAVSSTVIAVGSVVGFFVLASAAFCAWWFWLRRKFGAGGVVVYKTRQRRSYLHDRKSDYSSSTLRNKKHDYTQRQKSMIQGYMDYEDDFWVSGTEGADSIRLGYIPEPVEKYDETMINDRAYGRSSTASSFKRETDAVDDEAGEALVDSSDLMSPRSEAGELSRSPIRKHRTHPSSIAYPFEPLLSADSEFSRIQAPGPYPYPFSSHTKSPSMSMSGPFPNSGANRLSTMRLDSSPMYDIRASDYFDLSINNGVGGRRGRSTERESGGHRRASPSKASVKFLDSPLLEESGNGSRDQKRNQDGS